MEAIKKAIFANQTKKKQTAYFLVIIFLFYFLLIFIFTKKDSLKKFELI